MYLIHYVFVVWLQYALLGAALPAVVKASIVFTGTVIASWGVMLALGRIPLSGPLLGAMGRVSALQGGPRRAGTAPPSEASVAPSKLID
jgi:hypothetical protein